MMSLVVLVQDGPGTKRIKEQRVERQTSAAATKWSLVLVPRFDDGFSTDTTVDSSLQQIVHVE